MNRLAIVGFLAAAAVLDASPSFARYEGPWCARVDIGSGTIQELCSFRTFEDCRQEVYRSGPTTFCSQNPRFLPYWQGPAEQPPRHSKRAKRRHHPR